MSILVINCFHWLGFHIISHLLETGEAVDGLHIPSRDSREHLADFVGRNSQFQLLEQAPKQEYENIIIIGEYPSIDQLKAKRLIMVNGETRSNIHSLITVHANILFGEWMPMDLQGIYIGEKYVSFESDEFLREAIYVEDFVQILMTILQSSHLADHIYIRSREVKSLVGIPEEQIINLRTQTPIKEKIRSLQKHFREFRQWYEA